MNNSKLVHKNNFDFLRLLFASFVVITHSYSFLNQVSFEPLYQYTEESFSSLGVKGFFIISGYLIHQSLLRSKNLQEYFQKRVRRILPALLVVVFVSTFFFGPIFSKFSISDYFQSSETWVYWIANSFLIPIQPTLPGVFTDNPLTSAVNGSLWTLRFEFLFYVLITGLYLVPKKSKKIVYLSLLAALFLLYFWNKYIFKSPSVGMSSFLKHFTTLIIYFFSGSVISIFKDWFLKNKFYILIGSTLLFFITLFYFKGNQILLLISFPSLVLSFGNYSFPFLNYSRYIGDISYGTYIYAFPIQQMLISTFVFDNVYEFIVPSLLLSFLFGYLSWTLIEKQFLVQHKKST